MPKDLIQLKLKLSQYLTNFFTDDIENAKVYGISKLNKQGRASHMYSFYVKSGSGHVEKPKGFILRVFKGDVKDARKEFAVLRRLKEENLPVPTAHFFEEKCEIFGKPIMIMEKVNASDASEFMNNEVAAKHIIKRMAKRLVDIHNTNPWLIEHSDTMYADYKRKQKELLRIRFFITKLCPSFLGFSLPTRRRLIAAVKRLGYEPPKKVRPALLHLDYEPNHILVLNGNYIVVDWGMTSIGDPAYDVAWTYHKLRLERENAKVDLGEYFVKCYEEYSGKKLANLQYFKDTVAIEMTKFSGLLPFRAEIYKNYAKLIQILFGDLIGEVNRRVYVHRLRAVMAGHHTQVWTNINYIQSYALRYLEINRYETKD